jgi:CHAD domain-containing protein
MFSDTNATASAIATLGTARQILGDLNDDWTARAFYKDEQENPSDKTNSSDTNSSILDTEIHNAWNTFQKWSVTADLVGALRTLKDDLSQ